MLRILKSEIRNQKSEGEPFLASDFCLLISATGGGNG
jgi:hypothetical protein